MEIAMIKITQISSKNALPWFWLEQDLYRKSKAATDFQYIYTPGITWNFI